MSGPHCATYNAKQGLKRMSYRKRECSETILVSKITTRTDWIRLNNMYNQSNQSGTHTCLIWQHYSLGTVNSIALITPLLLLANAVLDHTDRKVNLTNYWSPMTFIYKHQRFLFQISYTCRHCMSINKKDIFIWRGSAYLYELCQLRQQRKQCVQGRKVEKPGTAL